MRLLAALIIAVTMLLGSTAAIAGSGAATGTILGATIGALTFNNKNTGAAVGAGVGLLVEAVADAEKRRIEQEKARAAQSVHPTRSTVKRTQPSGTERMSYKEYQASKRGAQYAPTRPAQYRSSYDNQTSGTARLVRERRVTTTLPDGSKKVVTTKIYDDPGW